MFAKIGALAVFTIKKNYGKDPDITGLWNTTMSTVCTAPSLRAKKTPNKPTPLNPDDSVKWSRLSAFIS